MTGRKTVFFWVGFFLLTWAAILPPSLCKAGMQELSDREMAAVYAYGFTTFSLTGDLARVDFNNIVVNTWTEISSMKLGYYSNGTTTAWDNDWTNVSLGSSSSDLSAVGLFIEVKFSNITDPATRQLEYIRIGTTNLTGTISADLNSFSGSFDNGVTSYSRTNLGTTSITSSGTGFYLSLERSGSQMGYSFHWVSATTTP